MNQLTLFPDILGNEVEQLTTLECKRTYQPENDYYVQTIRSLHEGYGHEAEVFTLFTAAHKKLKEDLSSMLSNLQNSNNADSTINELYSNAQVAAVIAIRLAAIAKRIMFDVKYDDLPPEAYGEDKHEELEYEESE